MRCKRQRVLLNMDEARRTIVIAAVVLFWSSKKYRKSTKISFWENHIFKKPLFIGHFTDFSQIISTHLLTVLTINDILHVEQIKQTKHKL